MTAQTLFMRQENEPMGTLCVKYVAVRYYQAREWSEEGKCIVNHAFVSASYS